MDNTKFLIQKGNTLLRVSAYCLLSPKRAPYGAVIRTLLPWQFFLSWVIFFPEAGYVNSWSFIPKVKELVFIDKYAF